LIDQLLSVCDWYRLVGMGDENQIPAFGPFKGCVLRELLKVYPRYILTRNYRQEQDPANLILPNATRVLEGEFPLKQDSKSFRIRPANKVHDAIAEHTPTHFENITFITGLNEHANQLNHLCVAARHQTDHPEWIDEEFQKITRNTFMLGDRLMFTGRVNRIRADDCQKESTKST